MYERGVGLFVDLHQSCMHLEYRRTSLGVSIYTAWLTTSQRIGPRDSFGSPPLELAEHYVRATGNCLEIGPATVIWRLPTLRIMIFCITEQETLAIDINLSSMVQSAFRRSSLALHVQQLPIHMVDCLGWSPRIHPLTTILA